MRSWLVLPALVFAACSPPSPFVGTWRYDVDATVTTAMGTETKKGTFEIDLSAATVADLIDWRMGGCNFVLAIKGQVAEQAAPRPLCGVTAGSKLPLLDVIGVTPKADDQLEVKTARFELLADGHLKTSFDFKLYTDLKDARVGPNVVLNTVDGKHGTKAK